MYIINNKGELDMPKHNRLINRIFDTVEEAIDCLIDMNMTEVYARLAEDETNMRMYENGVYSN